MIMLVSIPLLVQIPKSILIPMSMQTHRHSANTTIVKIPMSILIHILLKISMSLIYHYYC